MRPYMPSSRASPEGMYLLPAVIGLNVFARVARDGGTEMTAEIFRSIGALFSVVMCSISIPLARTGDQTSCSDLSSVRRPSSTTG